MVFALRDYLDIKPLGIARSLIALSRMSNKFSNNQIGVSDSEEIKLMFEELSKESPKKNEPR